MVQLGCDAFLTELTKLLTRCNAAAAGTLQLSLKRYAPNEDAAERAANKTDKPASTKSDEGGSKASQQTKKANSKQLNNKAKQNSTAAESSASAAPNRSSSISSATSSSSSSTSPSAPPPSTSEVSASDEPALLLHARLGSSVKLSTVVSAQQAAKIHRQLSSIITAKVSDGLAGGGRGGGGEAEAERKKRERVKQAAAKRKRQRDDREAKVTAGTASGGQVKRHKQEVKRREGNKRPSQISATTAGDVEMKESK